MSSSHLKCNTKEQRVLMMADWISAAAPFQHAQQHRSIARRLDPSMGTGLHER
jgi:hypothetical protein